MLTTALESQRYIMNKILVLIELVAKQLVTDCQAVMTAKTIEYLWVKGMDGAGYSFRYVGRKMFYVFEQRCS